MTRNEYIDKLGEKLYRSKEITVILADNRQMLRDTPTGPEAGELRSDRLDLIREFDRLQLEMESTTDEEMAEARCVFAALWRKWE